MRRRASGKVQARDGKRITRPGIGGDPATLQNFCLAAGTGINV
jgi:hypothetical protein